jgi:hypothetical protein
MSWKLRDRVRQKNIRPWKLKYLLETIADGCIGESTICAIGKFRMREAMGIDKKTLNGLIAKAEKQGLLTVEEKRRHWPRQQVEIPTPDRAPARQCHAGEKEQS